MRFSIQWFKVVSRKAMRASLIAAIVAGSLLSPVAEAASGSTDGDAQTVVPQSDTTETDGSSSDSSDSAESRPLSAATREYRYPDGVQPPVDPRPPLPADLTAVSGPTSSGRALPARRPGRLPISRPIIKPPSRSPQRPLVQLPKPIVVPSRRPVREPRSGTGTPRVVFEAPEVARVKPWFKDGPESGVDGNGTARPNDGGSDSEFVRTEDPFYDNRFTQAELDEINRIRGLDYDGKIEYWNNLKKQREWLEKLKSAGKIHPDHYAKYDDQLKRAEELYGAATADGALEPTDPIGTIGMVFGGAGLAKGVIKAVAKPAFWKKLIGKLKKSPGTGSGQLDDAYHYTARKWADSIKKDGLHPETFGTPAGNLKPLQAKLELALHPTRDAPGLRIRIDLKRLREAGYKIPEPKRVAGAVKGPDGRVYQLPAGGYEMQFPYRIPGEFLEVTPIK